MDALICEEAKQFNEATKYWEMAAVGYENNSKWYDAENCWRKLSNWEKVALACENQEKWLEAAKTYEELSNFENAARCYANRKDWSDAERCWRNLSNWEKVAVACENQGKWLDAAQEWEKAQNWQKVGDIYKRQERWDDALNLFRDHEMWSDLEKILKEIYTKLRWKITPEQGKQLAIALDNQKKYRDAIYYWDLYAKDSSRALRSYRSVGDKNASDWNTILRLSLEVNDVRTEVEARRQLEIMNNTPY
jgi:intraflagellar transport protein 172